MLYQSFQGVSVLSPEVDWTGLKTSEVEGDQAISLPHYRLKFEDSRFLIAESSLKIRSDPQEVLGLLPLSFIEFMIMLTLAQENSLSQIQILPINLKLN